MQLKKRKKEKKKKTSLAQKRNRNKIICLKFLRICTERMFFSMGTIKKCSKNRV